MFNENKWRLYDVITGDEIYYRRWIYYRQIGHKAANATLVVQGEPAGTVVRRNQFEPKMRSRFARRILH